MNINRDYFKKKAQPLPDLGVAECGIGVKQTQVDYFKASFIL